MFLYLTSYGKCILDKLSNVFLLWFLSFLSHLYPFNCRLCEYLCVGGGGGWGGEWLLTSQQINFSFTRHVGYHVTIYTGTRMRWCLSTRFSLSPPPYEGELWSHPDEYNYIKTPSFTQMHRSLGQSAPDGCKLSFMRKTWWKLFPGNFFLSSFGLRAGWFISPHCHLYVPFLSFCSDMNKIQAAGGKNPNIFN